MRLVVTAVAGLLTVLSARAGTVDGLYGTGVDATGTVLPPGSPDRHYALTGPISNAVVVERHLSRADHTWVAAPAGSAWIAPSSVNGSSPIGIYRYTLRFELTGLDPTAVELTGEFASDNGAKIFLNRNDTGWANRSAQYRQITSFSISKGFVAGVNTLEFRVTNGPPSSPNPSGLLVANLELVSKPEQLSLALPSPTRTVASAQPAPAFVASPMATALPRDDAFGYALPKDVGLTHWIESSSDLIHWASATNVTLYFKDADSTNYSEHFYRFLEK